jgi:hypothetical protein
MLSMCALVAVVALIATQSDKPTEVTGATGRQSTEPNFVEFPETGPEIMMHLYKSHKAIDIIKNPDEVLLMSIHYRKQPSPLWEADIIGHTKLPKHIVKSLSQELSNPQNYEFEEEAPCLTRLGAMLIFKKEGRTLTTVHSLSCPYMFIDPAGRQNLEEIITDNPATWFYSHTVVKAVETYYPDNEDLKELQAQLAESE